MPEDLAFVAYGAEPAIQLHPSDCAVFVGVPLDRDEFIRQAEVGAQVADARAHLHAAVLALDWSGNPELAWTAGWAAKAAFIQQRLVKLEGLGAHVEVIRSTEAIRDAARTFRVIVLATHQGEPENGTVVAQIGDRFYSDLQIADLVGADFDGALDLSMCQSRPCVHRIRSRCRRATVIARSPLVQPHRMLSIVTAAIATLARVPRSYPAALFDVVSYILEHVATEENDG